MGRHIKIKKVNIKNSWHYYEVDSPDNPAVKKFYLGIDPDNKILHYFKDQKCEEPQLSIPIYKSLKSMNIDWPPQPFLVITKMQVKKALDEGGLGECLSFQS